jgi:hypothetical protein
MNAAPARSLRSPQDQAVLPHYGATVETRRESPAARASRLQTSGRRMILAGFAITIVGIVFYCVVSLSGGMSASLADMLFTNAVPFARATLAVLATGTIVWLVGSLRYLKGAMDADLAEDTEL